MLEASVLPQRLEPGVHTVKGDNECDNTLRDPGSDLADVCDQSSLIHETVKDLAYRHLWELPGFGMVVLGMWALNFKGADSFVLVTESDVAMCYD